jgi:hypothetical protein
VDRVVGSLAARVWVRACLREGCGVSIRGTILGKGMGLGTGMARLSGMLGITGIGPGGTG